MSYRAFLSPQLRLNYAFWAMNERESKDVLKWAQLVAAHAAVQIFPNHDLCKTPT